MSVFLRYIERTWVGYIDENGIYHRPLFAHTNWVVVNRHNTGYVMERTTNRAEAWNKEFNKETGKNPLVC